jgi:hypothetical protein
MAGLFSIVVIVIAARGRPVRERRGPEGVAFEKYRPAQIA